MKTLDSRIYLYIATFGILMILALAAFYAFTPVSKSDAGFRHSQAEDVQPHCRHDGLEHFDPSQQLWG